MKNKIMSLRNCKILFCFTILLFFTGAGLLWAYSLEEQVKAMDGYDIYDSLTKTEWPVPSPRMSNKDLYKISEYVVGQGYQYFAVSPELPKGDANLRPNVWQLFLEGKEVMILAYDVIPEKSNWYVWDAKKVYRRARFHLGLERGKGQECRQYSALWF